MTSASPAPQPPSDPSSDPCSERVTGPFKGYHVVALGFRVDQPGGGFRGFYKICRGHPDNYWTAEALLDGRCVQVAGSGDGAMRMAERAAAREIRVMLANGPNAGWGYGSGSTLPFLREQREARSGEQFRGDAGARPPQPGGALPDRDQPSRK